MHVFLRCGCLVGFWSWIAAGSLAACADSTGLTLTQPRPHQVVQRTGTAPEAGFVEVAVHGDLATDAKELPNAIWEYRVVPLAGDAANRPAEWKRLDATVKGTAFQATARVAAGGWYRLEVRLAGSDESPAAGSVWPSRGGGMFLVAGALPPTRP